MKKSVISIFIAASAVLQLFPAFGEEAPKFDPALDWLYYSKGLECELNAISRPADERTAGELAMGLHWFLAAEKSGRERQRVYTHAANCLYFMGYYKDAASYAEKAIQADSTFKDAYTRLYASDIMMKKNEEAAAALERYLKINPESYDIRFMLGDHLLNRMQDPAEAEKYFLSVVNSDAGLCEPCYIQYSWYYLGEIAFSKNSLNRALECYENSRAAGSSDIKTVYMMALLYLNRYDLGKAEQNASLFLAENPDNPVMNSVMGRVCYIQGKTGAAAFLRKGTGDKRISGDTAKALLLQMEQKNDEAKELLNKIIPGYPGLLSCRMAMARIYKAEGNREGMLNELTASGVICSAAGLKDMAAGFFQQILEEDSTSAEAWENLGAIRADERKYSRAVLCFRKAYELSGDSRNIVQAGYVYGLNRQFRKAHECLDPVLKAEPENETALLYTGIVCGLEKDHASAEKHFRKIWEKNQTSAAGLPLAQALEEQKKHDEAIAVLETLYEKNQEDPVINNFLGYLYADRNINLDKAEILIKKALEKEPENGAITDSMGWLLFRKGHYSEALPFLLKAEKLLGTEKNPDTTVYDHIADTYLMLGDRQKADEYRKISEDMHKKQSGNKK